MRRVVRICWKQWLILVGTAFWVVGGGAFGCRQEAGEDRPKAPERPVLERVGRLTGLAALADAVTVDRTTFEPNTREYIPIPVLREAVQGKQLLHLRYQDVEWKTAQELDPGVSEVEVFATDKGVPLVVRSVWPEAIEPQHVLGARVSNAILEDYFAHEPQVVRGVPQEPDDWVPLSDVLHTVLEESSSLKGFACFLVEAVRDTRRPSPRIPVWVVVAYGGRMPSEIQSSGVPPSALDPTQYVRVYRMKSFDARNGAPLWESVGYGSNEDVILSQIGD